MSEIHPSAIIHEGAIIGDDCVIGPYAVIGPKVMLGSGNRVCSHVVIEGNTIIGSGNVFFQFASIGAQPQDLKYRGEDSLLQIGDNNIVREYVTLQPGTRGGGMRTVVGNGNLFMACSHLGHDGLIGNNNVIANSAALAGHVTVGDWVTVGGLAGIHQFVRLGDQSLIAAGAMVAQDVPPFCMVQGDRAELVGINQIGLERRGFSAEDVKKVKALYRKVFLRGGTLRDKLQAARSEYAGFAAGETLLGFCETSERGLVHARNRRADVPEGG